MTDASFKPRMPKTDLVRELLHGRGPGTGPSVRAVDPDPQGDLTFPPVVASEPN